MRQQRPRKYRVPPFGGPVDHLGPDTYFGRMAIRTIIEAPDPVLKTISSPVEKFDDELKTLVEDMFETMYDAPGIGLAAILRSRWACRCACW
jgi:hypothetical protein